MQKPVRERRLATTGEPDRGCHDRTIRCGAGVRLQRERTAGNRHRAYGDPGYYNAIGTHSFPSSGSVQFNYSLLTTDYGANGMTIQELGLFANAANVALPAAQGTSNPAWSATSAKSVGALIADGNGNLQRCTTAGTTGSAVPTWATAMNGTTTDGPVIWTLVAVHQAPSPLIAHVAVPAFTYTGTGNYSGTWTLTF
jgi:hypothetical protein